MKTSDETKTVDATVTKNVVADEQVTLQENVTEEPRSDEEMHLKYIMYSPSLVETYLAISDDKGDHFDDTDLEKDVIAFVEEYNDKEALELDKPAVVISQCQSLQKRYWERMERAEKITNGIQTKYGIRRGMLLNIEKKLLRKDGKLWTDHFTETYGTKGLRTAQDQMALAKIPNILRYAVFGKDRLMEAKRAIKILGIEGDDDPMATLLEEFEIPFRPEASEDDETLMELKLGVDYAVAIAKIKKAEEKEECNLDVDPDLIKRNIWSGNSINSGFINDLFKIKNEGRNVNAHLEGLCSESGNGDDMLHHIKRVIGLTRLVDGLKETVESITQHSTLIHRVEPDSINVLERCVTELKGILENGSITEG